MIKSGDDKITKEYSNQYRSQVKMNGHTSQLDLNPNGVNGFTSKLAEKVFGASTTFNGVQFHFHAGSEHTIDGIRHDLEMHTVHTADSVENEIGFAAVGIMFSVTEYNANLTWAESRIIENFFDSLKWRETSAQGNIVEVDMVTYGDLMELVDNENRWIYKGSVTTPPCGRFVYWNVLSTIYPISQKHLEQFKQQLNLGEGGNLDEYGNWRVI